MNCRNFTVYCRAVVAALGSIAILLMLSGTASAQLTNYATVVTFSGPVEVPGASPQVLPAGSYLFKVVDSKVNRNIVQISNKDETHIYTTILAIPTHREEATDKTVITFDERPAGQPPAIRAWYYPFEKSGQEFVYPKNRASELARASNSNVPYSDSGPGTSAVAGATQVAKVSTAAPEPIRAITPAGTTVEPAYQNNSSAVSQSNNSANSALPPAASQPSGQNRTPVQTASLPHTGSELPLLALIGSCSLFAGVSIRVIRALCVR